MIANLLSDARGVCLTEPFVVSLGGTFASFRCCCDDTRDALIDALRHLRSTQEASVSVCLIDADHASGLQPPRNLQWFGPETTDTTGNARVYGHQDFLCAWNHSLTEFVGISRRFPAEDFGFRENLRLMLQPVLGLLGVDGLHGGTLGQGSTGVLLTGRGGSGKSTLVSFGVIHGWSTTGDDFLLVSSSDTKSTALTIGSLFGTAKLTNDSPSRSLFRTGIPQADGKDLVDLREIGPQAVIPEQKIKALISCQVGSESRLQEAEPIVFLESLLPHSVGHTYHPQRLTKRFRKAANQIPTYSLTSGPQLSASLDLLSGLLR